VITLEREKAKRERRGQIPRANPIEGSRGRKGARAKLEAHVKAFSSKIGIIWQAFFEFNDSHCEVFKVFQENQMRFCLLFPKSRGESFKQTKEKYRVWKEEIEQIDGNFFAFKVLIVL